MQTFIEKMFTPMWTQQCVSNMVINTPSTCFIKIC